MGGKWLAQLIITDKDMSIRRTGQKKRPAEEEGPGGGGVVKRRFFIGRYDSESDARGVVRLVSDLLPY